MIKDVFDEMAAVRTERDQAASIIASARASAAEDDVDEYDLDAVDADEDAEYKAFLEELIRPQTDLSMNFACLFFASVFVTDTQQAWSYGPPYGQRRHTVHTVDHTATLKTV